MTAPRLEPQCEHVLARSFVSRALAAALTATCRASVDGFASRRGLDDAIEAVIEFRGPSTGRFVVAVPRSLLPKLFGDLVPRRGSAEVELAEALGALARSACSQVLRAKHDTAFGVVFSDPVLSPARPAVDGEIVVRVFGSWLAANLFDADTATGVS